MDRDGTVKIVDRSKDLIISGGEVSPFLTLVVNPLPPSTYMSMQNASSVAIEQG
jgi:hypothetical protein